MEWNTERFRCTIESSIPNDALFNILCFGQENPKLMLRQQPLYSQRSCSKPLFALWMII